MNQAETTEMDIVTDVQEARTLKHRSVAKCESLRSKSERNSLKKKTKRKNLHSYLLSHSTINLFIFQSRSEIHTIAILLSL